MVDCPAKKHPLIEMPQIQASLPPGIDLIAADDFEEWLLDIRVLDQNPLYFNQVYRLRFKFSSAYPIGRLLNQAIRVLPT